MKKAIVATIVLIAIAGLAVGAYFIFWDREDIDTDKTPQVVQNDPAQIDDEELMALEPITSIQQALDKLINFGLTPYNQSVVFYQMIGADDGTQFEIDGTRVELYIFNNGGPVLDDFMASLMSVDDFVKINGVYVVVHDSPELFELIRMALKTQ